MLRDTHIAAGVSAALAIVRPRGLLPSASVALAATCGSVISDIGAERSWARKKVDVIICVGAATVAAFTALAAVSGRLSGIVESLGTAGIIGKLSSLGMAASICIFGMEKNHRGFMHSITAAAILTACVYPAMSRQAACSFLIGFLSHIALDLLNYRAEQLLWPLKKKVCLHICLSDGIANRVLGEAFSVIAVQMFDICSGIGLYRFIESLAGVGW